MLGTKRTDRKSRTRTSYVAAADVPAIEELIAQYKRYNKLVARCEELIFANTRQERQLPRKPKKTNQKRAATPPEQRITVTCRRVRQGEDVLPSR